MHPLLANSDYDAFACLFGVRNYAGWQPVAAGRGLPSDATAEAREGFADDLHGATWVSWSELKDLDMTIGLEEMPGRLSLTEHGSEQHWHRRDVWPAEILERFGPLPWGAVPGNVYGVLEADGAVLAYQPVIRADVLGPGSGWEHVFAVMHALAARFGDDGVRLVVYFD